MYPLWGAAVCTASPRFDQLRPREKIRRRFPARCRSAAEEWGIFVVADAPGASFVRTQTRKGLPAQRQRAGERLRM